MKYLFAVNPISGKKKSKQRMNQLAMLLSEAKIDYMIYETQPYQYADDLKSEIIKHGITHVFSVGGDGTAHEVLNAVMGLDVYFGVLPFGTGNDFARTLNIPKKIDKVYQMIKNNQYIKIDVGQVENRYFLNYVSVGLDVEIAQKSIKFKRFMPSGTAYIIALLTSLIKFKCFDITINGVFNKTCLAAIHNGKFYGGGLKINPFAEANDGILDCCWVKKLSRFRVLLLFPTVFFGKHYKFKKFVQFESKREFTIDGGNTVIPTGVDGEIYKFNNPVEVKVCVDCVKLIVPKKI